jgi:hypothetical protein
MSRSDLLLADDGEVGRFGGGTAAVSGGEAVEAPAAPAGSVGVAITGGGVGVAAAGGGVEPGNGCGRAPLEAHADVIAARARLVSETRPVIRTIFTGYRTEPKGSPEAFCIF